MEQSLSEQLPPVQLFMIEPRQTDRVASLLTVEAADFLRSGQAFGLAAVEEGEVRGVICARLDPGNDTCLELLSLYVAPQHRRRRLGGTLLLELLEECQETFDGTLARVEASFSPEQGLQALLAKAGFRLEQGDGGACSYLTPIAGLMNNPLLKRRAVPPKGYALMPLEKLSRLQIRQLWQTLSEADADYMDLRQLSSALPSVSFVLLDPKLHPAACAILTGQGERLCLSQFFTAGGSAANAMAVLRAAAGALSERYPAGQLEIPLLSRSSAKLALQLAGSGGIRQPLLHAVLEL